MRPDILEYLDRHNVHYEMVTDMESVLGKADVIYQTRIHPERLRNRAGLGLYTIDSSVLPKLKPDAMILHPLPRTTELAKCVDADSRARYFLEAQNGLYVRMALLTMLLD
jgi:aspartate carbamoyltransferase catalytic subunit